MTVALLQCYMFSIGSILWRRVKYPETLPSGTFTLGKWGIPLNAFAVVWCAWSFVSYQHSRATCSAKTDAGRSSGHSGQYTLPSLPTASTGRLSSLRQSSCLRSSGTTLEDTRHIKVLSYLSRRHRCDVRTFTERVENRQCNQKYVQQMCANLLLSLIDIEILWHRVKLSFVLSLVNLVDS